MIKYIPIFKKGQIIENFSKLNLNEKILKAISDLNYESLTPIQEKAIPIARKGRDIIGISQSGTGKSCAFILPILESILKDQELGKNRVLRALIIAPTRELAKQIVKSIENYSKYMDVKTVSILGGESKNLQAKKLSNGVDIAVATAGRLLEHIKENSINLSSVTKVVIDELDVMLDMGFLKDLEQILPYIGKNRQISMFSATINSTVKTLAKQFLNDPVVIEVTTQRSNVKNITHEAILVDEDRKLEALSYFIGSKNISQALVFVNQKSQADTLVENLNLDGLKAACIHGDVRQSTRALALRKFKEKELRVLVATDIAARGIDIENLPCVINFALPQSIDDFTHRVGRTGRAGNDGLAITFLSVKDYKFFADIEKELILSVKRYELEGFATKEKKPRVKSKQQKSIKDKKFEAKKREEKVKKPKKTKSKKVTKRG
ncbi:DEAD/DEAH box helicase [Aliarcobacter skirrowii]|uniref:DEAD/DEAH box helicase n=1 Tax=Aliarcobacter skirrowii TaxID=28200 RepID=UPI0021B2C228|nr:DEAD/DEAH box helicase [Aliarcobacter skirrowii]MCT7446914.1 DEAD/DEAH box helicase [Aliarcobacter skirrowii]MDX3960057.1 DEAD/DEAH box helicase [Aliarcobacter skirrowii]MDX4063867.1 DEAD/DEAH box helicase [Aliarcobacter skirrowii]